MLSCGHCRNRCPGTFSSNHCIFINGYPILTHWPLGNLDWILGHVIFKQILVIDGWGNSCEIARIWMSLEFTDDQSTLVQLIAWCRQATSHYLSQCWPRSLSPYGVTRPQWVKWSWSDLTVTGYQFSSPFDCHQGVMPRWIENTSLEKSFVEHIWGLNKRLTFCTYFEG